MSSEADRFWRKVRCADRPDGCWEWLASKNRYGYGQLNVVTKNGRRPEQAHRVSWRLHFGEIPEGMCVCHTCDNPACVHPGHLFLGSKSDNNRDMRAKGRAVDPPGRKHYQKGYAPGCFIPGGGRFVRTSAS